MVIQPALPLEALFAKATSSPWIVVAFVTSTFSNLACEKPSSYYRLCDSKVRYGSDEREFVLAPATGYPYVGATLETRADNYY
ncbi:hypothetical protein RhiJN_26046 [Ceratobasidium sp. AG-Ba]|nr:hypothetical protein RhiJN_26046 [Ceratobasidium sp. AG-Ba]